MDTKVKARIDYNKTNVKREHSELTKELENSQLENSAITAATKLDKEHTIRNNSKSQITAFQKRLRVRTASAVIYSGGKGNDFSEELVSNIDNSFESLAPKDDIEAMIIGQLIALSDACLNALMYAKINSHNPDHKIAYLSQSSKLTKSFTGLTEVLLKYKNKDSIENKLSFQKVDVHSGGQAIVGNVYKTK